MTRGLAIVAVWLLSASCALAQTIDFTPPKGVEDPQLEVAIRDLAAHSIEYLNNADHDARLNDLALLQLALARYPEAADTLGALRELASANSGSPPVRAIALEIYANAKAQETTTRMSFEEAFKRAFNDLLPELDDRTAYEVESLLSTQSGASQKVLAQALNRYSGPAKISLPQSVAVVSDFLSWQLFSRIASFVGPLVDAEQKSRYVVETLPEAIVVRSKKESKPGPTLFNVTSGMSPGDIAVGIETAAHGYVSVAGFTRDKSGDDARGLIEWITKQPWSDGRVGMYSNSSADIAPWAVLKKPPPALKTIMTSGTAAPAYDKSWQRTIPYGDEFARINIPVLQTTGFLDHGQIGALWYFRQHYDYNLLANHTLLIGPYGPDLRYAWFDHVLKGAPRPAILSERINYQVMGSNEWRHVRSIAAMSRGSMTLHPAPTDLPAELVFSTEPFEKDTEVSGEIRGTLDFIVNKKDMDFSMRCHEVTSAGEHVQLTVPYAQRASYLHDRNRRQMLVPGKRQQLDFVNPGLVGRKVQAGSRIVLLLAIDTESNADARQPLRVQWFDTSVVKLPLSHDLEPPGD
jgi:hypothetical protein